MNLPAYVKFFKEEPDLKSINQKNVIKIVAFNPDDENNDALNEWATSFRRNYSDDDDLSFFSESLHVTKSKYLKDFVFPNKKSPGPAVKSGDFGEILVCDYLEFIKGYIVPRTRYDDKIHRNKSTEGSDVLAYKVKDIKKPDVNDEFLVVEVKSQATGKKANNSLQKAVDDTIKSKNPERIAESMLACERRLHRKGNNDSMVKLISRFMDRASNPCIENLGAAAVHSDENYSKNMIMTVDTSGLKDKHIYLLVIHCPKLMNVVNRIYERALQC